MATESVGIGTFTPNAAGIPKVLAISAADRAIQSVEEGETDQVVVQASGAQPQEQDTGDGGEAQAGDSDSSAGVDILA